MHTLFSKGLGNTINGKHANMHTSTQFSHTIQLGPGNVEDCQNKGSDGVFYPGSLQVGSMRWGGGPLERYAGHPGYINPFNRNAQLACRPAAASESFTEQGKYMRYMHRPSCGPSLLGPGHPNLQDCTTTEESMRGNIPIAAFSAKPHGEDSFITEVRWHTFAGLRGSPALQIRGICVGLREEALLLNRPEVSTFLTSKCHDVPIF